LCSSECKEKFINYEKVKINSRSVKCCECGKMFNESGSHYAVGGLNRDNHFCSLECAKIVQRKNPHSVIAVISPTKDYLEKENYELKKQLAEVKNQLIKVLEELKKLRNNSASQNNAELDQQIDYNEKLIRHVEEVPAAEIKEQVQKSEALLRNTTVNSDLSPSQGKENNNSSLSYVIGGSAILVAAGVISYFLVKKNKKSKVN
jgi:aspartokinase